MKYLLIIPMLFLAACCTTSTIPDSYPLSERYFGSKVMNVSEWTIIKKDNEWFLKKDDSEETKRLDKIGPDRIVGVDPYLPFEHEMNERGIIISECEKGDKFYRLEIIIKKVIEDPYVNIGLNPGDEGFIHPELTEVKEIRYAKKGTTRR